MSDSELAMQKLQRIALVLGLPVASFFSPIETANSADLDELCRIFGNLNEADERARMLKVSRSLFGKRQR